MFLRLLVSAIFFFVCFTSCDDDQVGPPLEFADVEMTFRGTYDSAPFVKNRIYNYEGSRIRFSDFHFFVSSLSATVNNDESFALDEVEFIDLAFFQSEAAAINGFNVNVGRAPVDTYDGFSFGIGVDLELNGSMPSEYGENHPLADPELFDTNLGGYKFFEIAGEVDFDNDTVYDEEFRFTIGFDANFLTVESSQNLEILPDVTNQLELDIDLFKVLKNIVAIDFNTQTATTANPDDEIMLILKSNIRSAISVR